MTYQLPTHHLVVTDNSFPHSFFRDAPNHLLKAHQIFVERGAQLVQLGAANLLVPTIDCSRTQNESSNAATALSTAVAGQSPMRVPTAPKKMAYTMYRSLTSQHPSMSSRRTKTECLFYDQLGFQELKYADG
jgi:hypothetical protein